MIWLVLVFQRFRIVDYGFTFKAHVFAERLGLQPIIAVMTNRTIAVLDEALIRKGNVAQFAGKAQRMPAGVQRFDYSPDYELFALFAGRRIQNVKVVLAVLAPFEFVKYFIVTKSAEAL